MLDCVTHCSQSTAHLYEQFLQVQQIGSVTLGPFTVHRGGCLELYYCNIVEWLWWDSSLISTTNWFPSVLWHCWFGHLACKNRPWMTYNVLSATLNPTHSLTLFLTWRHYSVYEHRVKLCDRKLQLSAVQSTCLVALSMPSAIQQAVSPSLRSSDIAVILYTGNRKMLIFCQKPIRFKYNLVHVVSNKFGEVQCKCFLHNLSSVSMLCTICECIICRMYCMIFLGF